MTTLSDQGKEDIPKKKRQRKTKEKTVEVAVKAAPQPTDYVIVLHRLEDGRILAMGDKTKGDETLFKDVLNRNALALFNGFKIDLAEDAIKYLPDLHVYYITEILT